MAVLTFADIDAAAGRLRGVAERTPVIRADQLRLKAEMLQRTGSFKFRGAFNHVASLTDEQRDRGVITVSSGNHAQALALAARLVGARCLVLMPSDAPAGKRAATAGHGAEIEEFDRYAVDREELLSSRVRATGMHPVHPYDHPLTMAGQGTVAVELIEDAGDLDLLVVPVGGGGLIGGCATAAKHLLPGCRVVGAEPAARPAMREALRAGGPVTVEVPRTIADGQQTSSVGAAPLEAALAHVDEVVGIDDASIGGAMRFAFERLKLVCEPSGASALAAVLQGGVAREGERVGVVLSGGNVDADRFAALTRGEATP